MSDRPAAAARPSVDALTLGLRYWLPVAAYAGLIFYLSSLPNPGALLPITIWDRLAHAIEYAGLAVLLVPAMLYASPVGGRLRLGLGLTVLLALLYGVSDEIHQLFVPNRSSDAWDVVADGIGATMGALVWLAWLGGRMARRPR